MVRFELHSDLGRVRAVTIGEEMLKVPGKVTITSDDILIENFVADGMHDPLYVRDKFSIEALEWAMSRIRDEIARRIPITPSPSRP